MISQFRHKADLQLMIGSWEHPGWRKMGDPEICRPDNNTYIISEQIIPKLGAPTRFGNMVGPGYSSVVRRIYGICVVQEQYYRGEPRPNGLSILEILSDYFLPGQQITLKPTGMKRAYLEYAGFTDLLTPIQGMNGILPEALSKTYEFTPL